MNAMNARPRRAPIIMETASHCKPFLRDPIDQDSREKTVEIYPHPAYDPLQQRHG